MCKNILLLPVPNKALRKSRRPLAVGIEDAREWAVFIEVRREVRIKVGVVHGLVNP